MPIPLLDSKLEEELRSLKANHESQVKDLIHTHEADLGRRLKQVTELSDEIERQAASILALR